MTTLMLETRPAAISVTVTNEKLMVELADGRTLSAPLAWYPRLLHGSPAERQHWQLLGAGYAIEWPDLDEHIGIEGLLAGRPSGESLKSLERWRAARAAQRGCDDNPESAANREQQLPEQICCPGHR